MPIQDYPNDEIERLLGGNRRRGEEDMLMLQPDGTRACVGWELTYGFHLVDMLPGKEKVLTDQELLESAYREAGLSFT